MERAWQKTMEWERSAEREVAEREQSGERAESAAHSPLHRFYATRPLTAPLHPIIGSLRPARSAPTVRFRILQNYIVGKLYHASRPISLKCLRKMFNKFRSVSRLTARQRSITVVSTNAPPRPDRRPPDTASP